MCIICGNIWIKGYLTIHISRYLHSIPRGIPSIPIAIPTIASRSILFFMVLPQCHFFVVGGLCTSVTRIAMLAGVFILMLGPPKPDRLKSRGQTK